MSVNTGWTEGLPRRTAFGWAADGIMKLSDDVLCVQKEGKNMAKHVSGKAVCISASVSACFPSLGQLCRKQKLVEAGA